MKNVHFISIYLLNSWILLMICWTFHLSLSLFFSQPILNSQLISHKIINIFSSSYRIYSPKLAKILDFAIVCLKNDKLNNKNLREFNGRVSHIRLIWLARFLDLRIIQLMKFKLSYPIIIMLLLFDE